MKNISYLLVLATMFLFSCKENAKDPAQGVVIQNLETKYIVTIDDMEEEISFDCTNSLSLYEMENRSVLNSDKFLYSQGFQSIPFSENSTIGFETMIYDTDINSLNLEELKLLIEDNQDIIQFKVEYTKNGAVYQNLFYELNGLNADYEKRKLVAENEVITFTIGAINKFECMDEAIIELDVEYSGILKTEDEESQIPVSLSLQIHLRKWL